MTMTVSVMNIHGAYMLITFFFLSVKVGFTVDNLVITLAESTNGMICVEILELEPSDIDRNINIPLQLLPKNTTSGICIQTCRCIITQGIWAIIIMHVNCYD